MIKDIIIAILAGITIVQRTTRSEMPDRWVLVMGISVMTFMILLAIDDLWDRRREILRRARSIAAAVSRGLKGIPRCICSWMRWYLIQLRTWPIETARRRRRRQMMQNYIQQLRNMTPQEHKEQIEEVE